jgi:hypothetical protein
MLGCVALLFAVGIARTFRVAVSSGDIQTSLGRAPAVRIAVSIAIPVTVAIPVADTDDPVLAISSRRVFLATPDNPTKSKRNTNND